MTRIVWIFDDSIVRSPVMESWLAEEIMREVGSFGLTVDPENGLPGKGLPPRRARLERDW